LPRLGNKRITLERRSNRNGKSFDRGGGIGLADQQQDWIDKYRAALDQQPARRTAPLIAAFNRLARFFGYTLGKISSKPIDTSQESAATRRSPEREMQPHSFPEVQANQTIPHEKSSHLKPSPQKKAS
jgi:hypothetical protein